MPMTGTEPRSSVANLINDRKLRIQSHNDSKMAIKSRVRMIDRRALIRLATGVGSL